MRDSLTKWCLIWKCLWSTSMSLSYFHMSKMAPIDIRRCLLNAYGDQIVDVSTARQWVVKHCELGGHLHLCRFLWAWHTGSCSSLVKMHNYCGYCAEKIVFCSWEFALSNSIIVLFVIVSMEINSRHYFQSDLCKWDTEISVLLFFWISIISSNFIPRPLHLFVLVLPDYFLTIYLFFNLFICMLSCLQILPSKLIS